MRFAVVHRLWGYTQVSQLVLMVVLAFADGKRTGISEAGADIGSGFWVSGSGRTLRPHSSSFLGLPYRILNMNPKRNYYGAYG